MFGYLYLFNIIKHLGEDSKVKPGWKISDLSALALNQINIIEINISQSSIKSIHVHPPCGG
jgi:hypothetical protein